MIKTGLTSITFRQYSPEKIVDITEAAGLNGIEWGADKHIIPGDIKYAGSIAKLCNQKKIEIISYGSYYRVGVSNQQAYSFDTILETAIALGAPNIRVWAGHKNSEEADMEYWKNIVDETRMIAKKAEKNDVTLSFEFHGNTLTNKPESAEKLMKDIASCNVKLYWQPLICVDCESNLAGLKKIMKWLTNIHVFHWWPDQFNRCTLKEGVVDWTRYLSVIVESQISTCMLVEFVKNDSLEQFFEDAALLKSLIYSMSFSQNMIRN